MRRPEIHFCLAWVAFFFAVPAQALNIIPTFTNNAGETWTAERQAVIQHAIDDWEAVIGVDESYEIEFDFTSAGTCATCYLARWSGSISAPLGASIRPWDYVTHTIYFNVDRMNSAPNWTWFDPTPVDDTGDPPFLAWDALSIALHEIGHSLGFLEGFFVDGFFTAGEVDLWAAQIDASDVFAPGVLNVQMEDDHSHYQDSGATADLLMNPSITNGQRQGISATDVTMLNLAYGYALAPEPGTALLLGIGLLVLARRRRG
jgi:hypothetical protein